MQPTKEQWDILLHLVSVGIAECPWAWNADSHYSAEEAEEAERAFQQWCKENNVTPDT